MSPHQQPMKPCQQHQTTSPWTEAYHAQAAMSQTPRVPQGTTPERPFENEAMAPTHDALSAIYNRNY
jgi:hypothetical protein